MSYADRARELAGWYAAEARRYGLEAEVTEHAEGPDYYDCDGSVMLPARTQVMLIIRETDVGVWGDTISVSWFAWDGVSGCRRASTKFCGGEKYALGTKTRKIKTVKRLALQVSCYSYKLLPKPQDDDDSEPAEYRSYAAIQDTWGER